MRHCYRNAANVLTDLVADKNMTALVGEDVTIPCETRESKNMPVNWYYLPSEHGEGSEICVAGNIVNGFRTRFAQGRSAVGEYPLIIRNVTREDKGEYLCIENAGVGQIHRWRLTIIGKIAKC